MMRLIFFSCCLVAYGYCSINIGLPAYPGLQAYFETSVEQIKLSIPLFLLSFGLAQPIWGTLSDRFGRRPIVLVGTLVTILGSVLTALSPTILFFYLGRVIEAFGSGVNLVIARAILADSFRSHRMHHAMSYISALVAIMPSIAPILGGEILVVFHRWQAIYWFLAMMGMLILFYEVFYAQETHRETLKKLSFRHTIRSYLSVLLHGEFMGYLLPYSFVLGGLIAFYTLAPYIFITHLHMEPNTYGYVIFSIAGAYMVGSLICQRFVKKLHPIRLICFGFLLISCAVAMGGFFSLFWEVSVYSVIFIWVTYALGCGFISPGSNASAMSVIEENKGSVAAIIGAANMLISGFLSGILALISLDVLYPLILFMGVIVCLSFSIFYFSIYRQS